jgi:Mrp family chromosome partitioning ATPase
MTPSDGAATTLVVRSQAIDACDRPPDGPPRVVPVRAASGEESIVAMLGPEWESATAALRVIRHRLELLRAQGMWTFGVTSARGAEGKTTLAAQLALVLSEAQRARVLLVEANLRRPALARLFGLRVPSGLGFSVQIAQRMAGGAEPWTVLALGQALHALVEDVAEPWFPDTLYATHFRSAIERLGRTYDWVIVDAPSVLGSGDANVVEEAVDGMIVAARSGASKGVDLRAAIRQLGGAKTVGVVLWDACR